MMCVCSVVCSGVVVALMMCNGVNLLSRDGGCGSDGV